MTLIIIGGATATGKTKLATELCKKIDGEIVSADSMQIYKGMDIGTAKETAESLGVPVHCVDIVSPGMPFTVVDYKSYAEKAIENIEKRGKIPVICGGTGYYISSLIYNYSYGGSDCPQEIYDKVYEQLNHEYDSPNGAERIHKRLAELDEIAASQIHPNNKKRLLRAVAVCETTGKPFSSQDAEKKKLVGNDIKMYILDYPDREKLRERIKLRVHQMLRCGLEDEIKRLLSGGATFDMQAMQAIGYKEWRKKYEPEAGVSPLGTDQVAEEIIKNTNAYAKRQSTWMRNQYPKEFATVLNAENGWEENLKSIINK